MYTIVLFVRRFQGLFQWNCGVFPLWWVPHLSLLKVTSESQDNILLLQVRGSPFRLLLSNHIRKEEDELLFENSLCLYITGHLRERKHCVRCDDKPLNPITKYCLNVKNKLLLEPYLLWWDPLLFVLLCSTFRTAPIILITDDADADV